uniref:Uncharacterized protein n=1 Tax=Romanomermis culicivorax TaxID=13658 RepID=A0A915HLR8_ROMCU
MLLTLSSLALRLFDVMGLGIVIVLCTLRWCPLMYQRPLMKCWGSGTAVLGEGCPRPQSYDVNNGSGVCGRCDAGSGGCSSSGDGCGDGIDSCDCGVNFALLRIAEGFQHGAVVVSLSDHIRGSAGIGGNGLNADGWP